MPAHEADAPHEFTRALDHLVSQVKEDRSVLAALLCGSLSHDTVWAKSDIDLVLVTVDDGRPECGHLSLNADGVNVHAMLMPRTLFRTTVEGEKGSSFMHSFLAKGRLLYSRDPTIEGLVGRLQAVGERDTAYQLMSAATQALGPLYKARKWLVTRGDLDYAALWLLYSATPLAQVEVLSARRLLDREVIPQALALNPAFFRSVYSDLLNQPKAWPQVEAALVGAERYVEARARTLFAPLLNHLKEAADTRTANDLEHHFARTMDMGGITLACEYLSDLGHLGKVSVPVRATKKSTAPLQELAFFYAGGPSDL
jgi:hypothetical protein